MQHMPIGALNPTLPAQNPLDDLEQMHSACLNAIASVAPIANMIRNPLVAQSKDAEKVASLTSLVTVMVGDINNAKGTFSRLKARADKAKCDNPDDLANLLSVGESYQRWTHAFEDTVVQTSLQILALINIICKPEETTPQETTLPTQENIDV